MISYRKYTLLEMFPSTYTVCIRSYEINNVHLIKAKGKKKKKGNGAGEENHAAENSALFV